VVAQVGQLLADAVEVVPVREVPVRERAAVATGRAGVAAMQDLRARAALPRQRLGLQAEVADAVEVARQVRLVLGPDALERGDELRCAPVALPMLEYPIRNMA
jgi:hypothetical protein